MSQELRVRLHQLGFGKIVIAGKGNYVFTIEGQKWVASTWKKVLMLDDPKWGIDVPSHRTWGYSPTFGSLILGDFSQRIYASGLSFCPGAALPRQLHSFAMRLARGLAPEQKSGAISVDSFSESALFFFRKSTTRSFYLMNFSQVALRGAEIWHIWKQHHMIECFWKTMKSIFRIRSMQLQGDGLYKALLIKGLADLLALRLQAQAVFSKLTITQIMRKLG